jgi:hypothetical protein
MQTRHPAWRRDQPGPEAVLGEDFAEPGEPGQVRLPDRRVSMRGGLRRSRLRHAQQRCGGRHQSRLWSGWLHRARLRGRWRQGAWLRSGWLHRARLRGRWRQGAWLRSGRLRRARLRGRWRHRARLRGRWRQGAWLWSGWRHRARLRGRWRQGAWLWSGWLHRARLRGRRHCAWHWSLVNRGWPGRAPPVGGLSRPERLHLHTVTPSVVSAAQSNGRT